MTRMEKEEEEKLLNENPHLKKYLEEIQKKMERPVFYNKVTRDLRGEKFPNIIYPTKGVVFVHIYRTKDMDQMEYHAIEPTLNENEKKKREKILEILYEKAHLKTDIKTQDELRKAIKEALNEITIVDERADDTDSAKKVF